MKLSDFHFELPDHLIARYPMPERTASRLLQVNGAMQQVKHGQFTDLLALLNPDDLLVFNDTRVLAARLYAKKITGGQLEVLIERVIDEHTVLAHMRSSKSPKPGAEIQLFANSESDEVKATATVTGRDGALFIIKFNDSVFDVLDAIGHMPLPPYMEREDELADQERYQTVYAKNVGAVAAPTAGLHFTDNFIKQLSQKGVQHCFVTLHVGAGTFQPVRTDNILEHKMHKEYIEVNETVCEQIRACRERGGRVVAVGTTAVRSLESASQSGEIKPFQGDSDIFIYPGYQFKSVNALITNFHLPESTLIMLVSAFAGRELVLSAYQEAVDELYRFYSYGDAMFVEPA